MTVQDVAVLDIFVRSESEPLVRPYLVVSMNLDTRVIEQWSLHESQPPRAPAGNPYRPREKGAIEVWFRHMSTQLLKCSPTYGRHAPDHAEALKAPTFAALQKALADFIEAHNKALKVREA